jgi:ABC-type lipoprotein release transport system permease subunit
MFGFDEEQLAWFGMTFGVAAFVGYMFFIIWQLARESKAGRFGSFVLFIVLGFGMIGFIAKGVIKLFIGGG